MTENTHPNTWGQPGSSSNPKQKRQNLPSPRGFLWFTKSPLPAQPSQEFESIMGLFYAGKHQQLHQISPFVFDDLLTIMSQHLSMVARRDVCFFRVGFTDEEATLSAVVTVAPDVISIAKAKEVADMMKEAMKNRGLSDIEVAIIPATITSTDPTKQAAMAPSRLLDNLVQEMPPSKVPKVGSSVGFGPLSAGTLGCLVTINGPNAGTYGLTNCHVAMPYEWNQKPMRLGFPPKFSALASPKPVRPIDQPSQTDAKKIISSFVIQREGSGALARDAKKDLEDKARHKREPSSAETAAIGAMEDAVKEADAMIQTMSNIDLKLGQLSFASGHRLQPFPELVPYALDTPNYMDWALIGLDRARVGPDPLRNEMHPFQISHGVLNEWATRNPSSSSTCNSIEMGFRPKLSGKTRDILPHFKSEDSPIYVLKRGRSTGWTAGRINNYQSYSQRIDNDDPASPEVISMELVVNNLVSDLAFSKQGDSGSVVFERNGDVAGLVHSAFTMGELGPSLYTILTPIDLIFKDIAASTGATEVTINQTEPDYD